MTEKDLEEASTRILNEFARCGSIERIKDLIEKSIGDFMLVSIIPSLSIKERMEKHKEFLNERCEHILEDLEAFHKGRKLHSWKMPEETEN